MQILNSFLVFTKAVNQKLIINQLIDRKWRFFGMIPDFTFWDPVSISDFCDEGFKQKHYHSKKLDPTIYHIKT
jgi:hypothetical protein